MALAVKCGSNMKRASEGYGVGLVRSSSFGRKRVALSEICTEFRDDDDYDCSSIPKRQCFQDSFLSTDKSALENLPQEILVSLIYIFSLILVLDAVRIFVIVCLIHFLLA